MLVNPSTFLTQNLPSVPCFPISLCLPPQPCELVWVPWGCWAPCPQPTASSCRQHQKCGHFPSSWWEAKVEITLGGGGTWKHRWGQSKQTDLGKRGQNLKHVTYLPLFKPVRGALCKEELLWGTSDTFLFSVGVSKGKTNSLLLLHQVSPPLFPANVLFFVLLQKHSCPSNRLQHGERGEEIKMLLRAERYLMFQSGSEGFLFFFFSFKVPVMGRLGKHARWLSWGRGLGWSGADVEEP